MLYRILPVRCASLIEEGVRREADASLTVPDTFYTERELADQGLCVVIVATPNDTLRDILRTLINARKPRAKQERRSA